MPLRELSAHYVSRNRCARRRRIRALLVVFLLFVVPLKPGAAPGAKVIVHPDVDVSSISVNDARLYLTRRVLTWPDLTPVHAFVFPDDSALHADFARSILHLFPYQLRRAWDRLLFSGTGQVPTVVSSEEEMLRRVASTPGSIGYVETIPEGSPVRELTVR